MKTRIISAVVGLAILVAVFYFFETVVLDIAVALLSAVAVYEMINAIGLAKDKTFAIACAAFGAFFSSDYYRAFGSLTGFAEFCLAVALFIYVLKNHKVVKATDVAFAFMFTVVLPRAFSVLLLFRNQGTTTAYFFATMSLAIAWLNDTCAYFSGYFFGKRKLCPDISPKKTVEGAIGGVIGDVLLCSVIALLFESFTDLSLNWLSVIIFMPIGAVLGILGDLAASIIKRQVGIKDYGKIMPGHGGVMDRFDSWIFIAPILYIWNIYFPFVV